MQGFYCPFQILILLFLALGVYARRASIPEELKVCYDEKTDIYPMTLKVLIDIIKKIESSTYYIMDMRILSNLIIHRFWIDGIELGRNIVMPQEGVIPYKTSGYQSYRYQLISQKLIPVSLFNFPNSTLTVTEKCTLHFMMSSSIDVWERGNENIICPEYGGNQKFPLESEDAKKSSCPIEKGVIDTKKYGTVSLNHIIAGIGAALEPMQVPLSVIVGGIMVEQDNLQKNIDNRWAATIAGDLAETLIAQIPILDKYFYFGPGGIWNDSDIPIEYYMISRNEVVEKELWQFTNAEIMGALDGLMIAEELTNWESMGHMIRLSQLLELFYSNKVINNVFAVHACKRKVFFEGLMRKRQQLSEQVQNVAQVFVNSMPNYFISDLVAPEINKKLHDQFDAYVMQLLKINQKCPDEMYTVPKINLNVIFDHTWDSHGTLKLLMSLGEKIHVSSVGSEITLIAGKKGRVLADSVNFIGNLYLYWKHGFFEDLGITSLPSCLIATNSRNAVNTHFSTSIHDAYSYITLVFGMNTILKEDDISNSMILIEAIKKQNPDMIFIYVTSTAFAPMYVKLTSVPGAQDDKIITFEGNGQKRILEELGILNNIPRAIKSMPCGNLKNDQSLVEIEDGVSPGENHFYRIHPKYFCGSWDPVQMNNGKNGNLYVCISRDEKFNNDVDCKEASLGEFISFKINYPCTNGRIYGKDESWNENCKPIYIKISSKRSLTNCAVKQCRMPNEVRFQILVEGLKCIGNDGCNKAANVLFNHTNNIVIISVILLISI